MSPSRPFSETAPPAPFRVEVRTWPLQATADVVETEFQLLSSDERQRADRFIYACDRADFIIARAGLRRHLGRLLHKPPEQLAFKYTSYGRPELTELDAETALTFNLSHSGRMAAACFTRDGIAGIDIEAIREIEHDVAGRFFSEAEQRQLASLPSDQWLRGFFNCWTRKEAYVKALGLGIGIDLTAFDVELNPGADPAVLRDSNDPDVTSTWRLVALPVPPTYVAALALKTNGRPLHVECDGRIVISS